MANQIISALDIGSSKIAVIIAKISDEDTRIRIMGYAQVPSKGVKKGQIIDIHQVSDSLNEALSKCERMAGVQVRSASVAIGGPHIESCNSKGVVAVNRPQAEIESDDVFRVIEASKAISTPQTRQVIDVVPREFTVDYQSGIKNPIGMTGVRLEVDTHIITASVTNLRNVERCMDDLDVKLDRFVYAGLASSQACLSETEKELGIVVVDIGGGKMDISIFVEGALSHSTSIAIGAKNFTNDLAIGLRISLDSAEKVKIFLSNTHAPSQDKINIESLNLPEELKEISFKEAFEGILKPRYEELGELIYKEIEKTGFLTMVPSGIVLTGGGSRTLGILPTMKQVLMMPVRLGAPHNLTGLSDEVLNPGCSTIVGLLLSMLEHEDNSWGNSRKKLNLHFSNPFKGKFSFNLSKIFKNLTS